MLAERFDGKRLNSPNDVVVKSDGTIWFSDPTYGIDSEYEGDAAPREIGGCNVYRIDPASGEVTQSRPISSSRTASPSRPTRSCSTSPTPAPPTTRRSAPHPRLRGQRRRPFARPAACSPNRTAGLFDGFRVDAKGNIWTCAGDGVHVYAPERLDRQDPGSGERRQRLLRRAEAQPPLHLRDTSLYAIYVNTRGASWPS